MPQSSRFTPDPVRTSSRFIPDDIKEPIVEDEEVVIEEPLITKPASSLKLPLTEQQKKDRIKYETRTGVKVDKEQIRNKIVDLSSRLPESLRKPAAFAGSFALDVVPDMIVGGIGKKAATMAAKELPSLIRGSVTRGNVTYKPKNTTGIKTPAITSIEDKATNYAKAKQVILAKEGTLVNVGNKTDDEIIAHAEKLDNGFTTRAPVIRKIPEGDLVKTATIETVTTTNRLPKDLQGAKPRFNFGTTSYTPVFESDLDKALFIIAQKTASKRDADYLKFVIEQTGLDEFAARQVGVGLRGQVKNLLKGQEPGEVKIPSSFTKAEVPVVNKAPVKIDIVTGKPKITSERKVALNNILKEAGIEDTIHPAHAANKIAKAKRVEVSRIRTNDPVIGREILEGREPALSLQEPIRGALPPIKPPSSISPKGGNILPSDKPVSKTREAWELLRSLKSVDVPFMTSAAFRQGSPLIGTKNWFKAYGDSVKSFKDEDVYTKIMTGLDDHIIHKARIVDDKKLVSIADQIGLKRSNLKSLTSREEQIRGTLAEKIPVYGKLIRANNRSYTAFLDSLRTNTAEQWLKADNLIDKFGNVTDVDKASRIANTINELTGYGSLKIATPFSRFSKVPKELDLERHADLLSTVFFSPRNTIRDARMMNPLNYMKNNKLVRLEYLKGAARRALVWAGFTGLASIGLGAEVSNQITNSDFGKAKIGNTRADAGTGLLQWMVLLGREALGETTSSVTEKTRNFGEGFNPSTGGSVASDFLRNRLHPSAGKVVNALTASEGKPFYAGSETADAISPFPVSDLVELMQSDPEINELIMGLVANTFSMGSQTYGRGDFGKPSFNIPGDMKYEGGSIPSLLRGR